MFFPFISGHPEKPAGASYIFGTLHQDFHVPEELFEVITACDEFVMECDQENMDASVLKKLAFYTGEETLKDVFPVEHWSSLVEYVARRKGYKEDFVKMCKPWFLQTIIENEKPAPEKSLDFKLRAMAEERSMPASFLETATEFCRNSSRVPVDEQIMMICEVLDGTENVSDNLQAMIQAYGDRDAEALKDHIFTSRNLSQYPQAFKVFWTDRNLAWLPRLIEKVERGRAFIMVGAGHLIGMDNLIELLKAEKLVVEEVVL